MEIWDVLIVEDVDAMRAVLERVVGGIDGVRVSGLVHNVWEARLALQRRRPHLVLLDEILPGESSVELLTELQRLAIPTLLITGIENATHAMPPGAAGRLFKPTWESIENDRLRFAKAIDGIRGRC